MNNIVFRILLEVRKNPKSPYVFCKKGGSPYRNITGGFTNALKRARIRDFRFHDLRHTFASLLVMAGIDLKTVQELLGHKTFEMTLRYAHLSQDHKRWAMNVLGHRLDTIWTPEGKKAKKLQGAPSLELGYDEAQEEYGRVVELADAHC